jgi:hypothetical protein
MRLFGRKPVEDEVEERCPQCNEPMPDGATQCTMCGIDLRPFRGLRAAPEVKSPQPN